MVGCYCDIAQKNLLFLLPFSFLVLPDPQKWKHHSLSTKWVFQLPYINLGNCDFGISNFPFMMCKFRTGEEFCTWLFRELNSLLAHLQHACNIHNCCIFLGRKHGMDAKRRSHLVQRHNQWDSSMHWVASQVIIQPRLLTQRQLLETSGMPSGTTGICPFWWEWWWQRKEETPVGQLLG